MDAATAAAIFLPPLLGLGGVVLGARLNRASALAAARDEREWSERQRRRIREEEAAKMLDERLVEVLGDPPQVQGAAEELAPRIAEVRLRVAQAWQRSTVLRDPEVMRRMNALDMAMLIAVQHADTERVQRWANAS